MTYGLNNRIVTYNGQTVTYDPDGNMIHGPLNGAMQDYTYDSKSRLIQVGSTHYIYDAENKRIASYTQDGTQTPEDTEATKYTVDSNADLSQLLVKTNSDGSKTYYIYGLGLIAQEGEAGYKTYHFDKRGSTVALIDETGSTTDEFFYGPYGEILAKSGNTDTPFKFNGSYGVMTDDNGLYYMRARYYNPEIKRFVNQDTILGSVNNGQSLNRFAYVNGDPVSLIDPFGLFGTAVHSGCVFGKRTQKYYPMKDNNEKDQTYGTFTWALQKGFSNNDAGVIATSDNLVDKDYHADIWSPIDRSRHRNEFISRLGLAVGESSQQWWADYELDNAIDLEKAGDHKGALQALGRALHSIQDLVAHGGESIYEDKHYLHGINQWLIEHDIDLTVGGQIDNPDEWLKRSKDDQLLTKMLTQRYLQEFLDATKTGKTKKRK
jgi:RHS repeat-associated protein